MRADLQAKIEAGWTVATTWCPETYQGKDRAWGQCAVTALYLHDHHGAHLVRGLVRFADPFRPSGFDERTHFWNRVCGVDVDLTRRQFPSDATFSGARIVTRAEVLQGNEWFFQRYRNFLGEIQRQSASRFGWGRRSTDGKVRYRGDAQPSLTA